MALLKLTCQQNCSFNSTLTMHLFAFVSTKKTKNECCFASCRAPFCNVHGTYLQMQQASTYIYMHEPRRITHTHCTTADFCVSFMPPAMLCLFKFDKVQVQKHECRKKGRELKR